MELLQKNFDELVENSKFIENEYENEINELNDTIKKLHKKLNVNEMEHLKTRNRELLQQLNELQMENATWKEKNEKLSMQKIEYENDMEDLMQRNRRLKDEYGQLSGENENWIEKFTNLQEDQFEQRQHLYKQYKMQFQLISHMASYLPKVNTIENDEYAGYIPLLWTQKHVKFIYVFHENDTIHLNGKVNVLFYVWDLLVYKNDSENERYSIEIDGYRMVDREDFKSLKLEHKTTVCMKKEGDIVAHLHFEQIQLDNSNALLHTMHDQSIALDDTYYFYILPQEVPSCPAFHNLKIWNQSSLSQSIQANLPTIHELSNLQNKNEQMEKVLHHHRKRIQVPNTKNLLRYHQDKVKQSIVLSSIAIQQKNEMQQLVYQLKSQLRHLHQRNSSPAAITETPKSKPS